MIDPVITVGTGLAILGSKDLLTKLLGPSADYIGGEIKGFVQKCNINVDRVFEKACNKLGKDIETPGVINPRVLMNIINDARFCEDEIQSEYYGGFLASSRSKKGHDDRAMPHIVLVKELSLYQIKIHYLIYFLLRQKYSLCLYNIGNREEWPNLGLFIPFSVYYKAMNFEEDDDGSLILTQSLSGIRRHFLIHKYWFGPQKYIHQFYKEAQEGGIVVIPSLFGAELYLWANGFPNTQLSDFFNVEGLPIDSVIPINAGSCCVSFD